MSQEFKLEVTSYRQAHNTTCWYASYKSLYSWKDRATSEILPALHNAGLDTDAMFDRGMIDTEYMPAAKALRMSSWRTSSFKQWDVQMLIHVMRTYGPIFCATQIYQGHAVVLYGARPDEDKVWYIDSVNPSGGTARRILIKRSEFLDLIQDTFFSIQAWEN